MAKNGGVWEVHGLTSWGIACRSKPGVYATVQRKSQSEGIAGKFHGMLWNVKQSPQFSDVNSWIRQNIGSECQRAG